MSNTVSSESVTCPSCEYRYPGSEAICVMCGTAALAVEPPRPLSSVPDEFSGANPGLSPSDRPRPRLRGLILFVVILMALMVVILFFYRKGSEPRESALAAQHTATSWQPKLENASQRRIIHKPDRGVQHFVAAKVGPPQTIEAGKEDDPVKLWKAVRRGSVRAEVALANLYLEGEAVPQSCEQAHMLLYAASMKGNKAADTFLKNSYAARCE